MAENKDREFFLPDLCQAQSILLLVLVTELLVLVLVLFESGLYGFNWSHLGLVSMFVQWVVLLSAAMLCNLRPFLSTLTTFQATTLAYVLILLITLIFSVGSEMLFTAPSLWDRGQTMQVGRNLLIATIMTGIAFRYFFLQNQLIRQEQAELNSRVQALQSRIRPHFLFNSMNIIASLISIDPERAEEVVEDLSVLFRASLSDTSNEPVSLNDELELCEKYVHIESLRLDERLKVTWQVDVEPLDVRIPLLTLQPLLENAIYHGIQPLPEGGEVQVKITEADGFLEISISNPVAHENHSHESGNRMALDNIRSRLEAIYGPQASVVSGQSAETYTTEVRYPVNVQSKT